MAVECKTLNGIFHFYRLKKAFLRNVSGTVSIQAELK